MTQINSTSSSVSKTLARSDTDLVGGDRILQWPGVLEAPLSHRGAIPKRSKGIFDSSIIAAFNGETFPSGLSVNSFINGWHDHNRLMQYRGDIRVCAGAIHTESGSRKLAVLAS